MENVQSIVAAKKILLGKLRSFKKILKTCVLIYNGLIIKQERISSPEGTEILSSVVLVKKTNNVCTTCTLTCAKQWNFYILEISVYNQ